jgi:hypothetical protein
VVCTVKYGEAPFRSRVDATHPHLLSLKVAIAAAGCAQSRDAGLDGDDYESRRSR